MFINRRKQLEVIRWKDLREEPKLLAFTGRKDFSSLIMTRTPRPHEKKESFRLLAVKHCPRSREEQKILSSLQGENNFLEKAVILREEENSPNLQEEKNCSVSRQEINFLF